MGDSVKKFSSEVRARALQLVLEHEDEYPSRWTAMVSIAGTIGCSVQTLNEWVKKIKVETGMRAGVPAEIPDRLKALEREVRNLRQANEIPWKASACFAKSELDRLVRKWLRSSMEYATIEEVDRFNNRSILEAIGNIMPAEAEQQFYATMESIFMAS